MSTFKQCLLLVAVLLGVACGGGGGAPVQEATFEGSRDTSLGVSDVFAIRVYGEDDLSGTYRVARDGTIDFPLIGRVRVEGMEPPQVADMLERRLQEGQFLKRPQISILVEEYNSKRISVVGAVAKPGSYPMVPGMTLVQAVSGAGGFTALANENNTTVTRRVGAELKRFQVPAGDITEGTVQDFRLQAGDIIYVPERVF